MSDKKDYLGDVVYEVWRRGGNSDAVDYDRVCDNELEGMLPEASARRELNIQNRERERVREIHRKQEEQQVCCHCEECCNCYGSDNL